MIRHIKHVGYYKSGGDNRSHIMVVATDPIDPDTSYHMRITTTMNGRTIINPNLLAYGNDRDYYHDRPVDAKTILAIITHIKMTVEARKWVDDTLWTMQIGFK